MSSRRSYYNDGGDNGERFFDAMNWNARKLGKRSPETALTTTTKRARRAIVGARPTTTKRPLNIALTASKRQRGPGSGNANGGGAGARVDETRRALLVRAQENFAHVHALAGSTRDPYARARFVTIRDAILRYIHALHEAD